MKHAMPLPFDVAQVSNLLYRRLLVGRMREFPGVCELANGATAQRRKAATNVEQAENSNSPAEWNSAIQQIRNLRYSQIHLDHKQP